MYPPRHLTMKQHDALAGASVSSNAGSGCLRPCACAPPYISPLGVRATRISPSMSFDESPRQRAAAGTLIGQKRPRRHASRNGRSGPHGLAAELAHSTSMRSAQAISVPGHFHVSHERPSVCQRDPLVAKAFQQRPASGIDCCLQGTLALGGLLPRIGSCHAFSPNGTPCHVRRLRYRGVTFP